MSKKQVADAETSRVTNEQNISRLLSFGNGTKINLAYTFYEIIKKAPEEDRIWLVQFLAESWDYAESSKEVNIDSVISEEEKEQLTNKYGKIVNAMFTALIAENKEQNIFYKDLWELINNPFFADDKAKAFALYYILIDRKIPYFQTVSGLKMSNEDFKLILQKLRNSRAKIRFIMSKDYDQRTEQADLIMKTIREHTDSEQAVLMSVIITEFNLKMERLASYYKQAGN
jgi:hypothetical protein